MEDWQTPKWYVLQTMSGRESRVLKSLGRRCAEDRASGIDNGLDEVVIPTERIEERRSNQRPVVRERKLYPGYVLIKCRLYKEEGKLDPETWGIIRDTDGVIGFIGGETPVPLSQEDVEQMIHQQGEDADKPKPKVTYHVGDTIIIKEGAFENFEGVVEDVDQERMRLKVSVTIFGRSTPCEVDFWQVERP